MKVSKLNPKWINNGKLQVTEPRTLNKYLELIEESRKVDCSKHHCFFAFSNEQFAEGKKEAGIKDEEKIYSFGAGMFGTKDGIESYLKALNKDNEIRKVCNPYEIYLYEFDNYECCIDGEGDYRAMATVISFFGDKIAEMIPRKRAYYDIDRVYKEMARDSR